LVAKWVNNNDQNEFGMYAKPAVFEYMVSATEEIKSIWEDSGLEAATSPAATAAATTTPAPQPQQQQQQQQQQQLLPPPHLLSSNLHPIFHNPPSPFSPSEPTKNPVDNQYLAEGRSATLFWTKMKPCHVPSLQPTASSHMAPFSSAPTNLSSATCTNHRLMMIWKAADGEVKSMP
jgi:hypothetical protein